MKRLTRISGFLVASVLMAACSSATPGDDDYTPPPPAGHTYQLTIQGDVNVFLGNNQTQTLYVRYTDDMGTPLAGLVSFRIDGTANGATLSAESDVTDPEGIAQVEITAGSTGEAAFQVVAEAEYATAVNWRVAVSAGPPPPAPLTMNGVYLLDSQFNLVQGLPGTAGTIVNTIIDMTDGPNDPATWIIDLALSKIDNQTVKDAVNGMRPVIDSWLNDIIKSNAPSFVNTLLGIGDKFGQVTKKFGVVSTLSVTPTGATHNVEAFVFVIDGVRSEWTLGELDMGNIQATGVSITMGADSRVYISDHTLPVSYGKLILFALNNIIIPMIDPYSHNLNDIINYFVDCYSLSFQIADYVGIGSPGLYEAACEMGIQAGTAYIEDKIMSLDAEATALVIHGDAKPLDTNGDRVIDLLQNGLWEGNMNFGPLASTLAKPDQKFQGQRQGAVP